MEANWTVVICDKKGKLPEYIKFTGYDIKKLEERWHTAVMGDFAPGGGAEQV